MHIPQRAQAWGERGVILRHIPLKVLVQGRKRMSASPVRTRRASGSPVRKEPPSSPVLVRREPFSGSTTTRQQATPPSSYHTVTFNTNPDPALVPFNPSVPTKKYASVRFNPSKGRVVENAAPEYQSQPVVPPEAVVAPPPAAPAPQPEEKIIAFQSEPEPVPEPVPQAPSSQAPAPAPFPETAPTPAPVPAPAPAPEVAPKSAPVTAPKPPKPPKPAGAPRAPVPPPTQQKLGVSETMRMVHQGRQRTTVFWWLFPSSPWKPWTSNSACQNFWEEEVRKRLSTIHSIQFCNILSKGQNRPITCFVQKMNSVFVGLLID